MFLFCSCFAKEGQGEREKHELHPKAMPLDIGADEHCATYAEQRLPNIHIHLLMTIEIGVPWCAGLLDYHNFRLDFGLFKNKLLEWEVSWYG